MSEKTARSLAALDALLPLLNALPPGADRESVVAEAEALRRAVAAFHMEAIRFRMYSVDRALKRMPEFADGRALFEQLRSELESVGFHTRSHTAP